MARARRRMGGARAGVSRRLYCLELKRPGGSKMTSALDSVPPEKLEPDQIAAPSHEEPAPPNRSPGRRLLRRIIKCLGVCLLTLLIAGMAGWATLAIYFADIRPGARSRTVLATACLFVCIVLTIFVKPRRWGLLGFIGVFGVGLAWYLMLKPSNARDWQADVARTPQAIIDGDRITVRNVRHFHYRSTDDFTPAW